MRETGKWLLALLRPYRGAVFAGSLLVALTVLGNAGLLATSGLLLSKAALEPEVLLLMPLITGVRFFGIGRALMRYAERLINHSIAFRILGHLRKDFYDHLEPLVPDALPRYSQGKLYNQFVSDINVLQYFYLKAVSVPLGSLMVYLVCALFLAFYVPVLIPVLLLGHLVAGLVVPGLSLSGGRAQKYQLADLQTQISEQFPEYKSGMADLRLFGKLADVQQALKAQVEQLTWLAYRMSLRKRLISRLVFALSHLSMLLALWLMMPSVTSGALPGVDVAMIGLLVLASYEAVLQMPEAVLQMDESLAAASALREVYTKTPYPRSGVQAQPKGAELVCRDVDFHYHQAGRRFIEHLDLTIPEGAHVALVGESGSGKSSLAKILSGLWQIDGGSLTVGGAELGALDEGTLHEMIASVDQDSYFFHATIRENLQLARADATDEAIWQALAMVEMDGVVKGLAQGLDTVMTENGADFSGGQRQRLAIARVILQDTPVVILDEALQKLDKKMAQRIFARLENWAQGRTLIVISHSLLLVEALSFTYVMAYGRIIEKGSRQALLALPDGHYRALYEIERGQF
ncbi:MAG: thiol reductant ABC exporter subunit CydC [Peptococcaceae bacterium]|nr:thiol reductant ABC exporter subunit CydC [Peptococcaceae bacterium]